MAWSRRQRPRLSVACTCDLSMDIASTSSSTKALSCKVLFNAAALCQEREEVVATSLAGAFQTCSATFETEVVSLGSLSPKLLARAFGLFSENVPDLSQVTRLADMHEKRKGKNLCSSVLTPFEHELKRALLRARTQPKDFIERRSHSDLEDCCAHMRERHSGQAEHSCQGQGKGTCASQRLVQVMVDGIRISLGYKGI